MKKLILAIIFNNDAVDPLANALIGEGYAITKISSSGGFLRRQNTTLVIGVDEDRVPGAMDIIRKICTPFSRPEGHAVTIFVLDVAEFDRA